MDGLSVTYGLRRGIKDTKVLCRGEWPLGGGDEGSCGSNQIMWNLAKHGKGLNSLKSNGESLRYFLEHRIKFSF